jgi:hypothetical protein
LRPQENVVVVKNVTRDNLRKGIATGDVLVRIVTPAACPTRPVGAFAARRLLELDRPSAPT